MPNSSQHVAGPIFVVGCSRGGTTLLHSILGNSPALHAFPETNTFFGILNDLDYRRYGPCLDWRQTRNALTGRMLNAFGYTHDFSWASLTEFLASQPTQWTPKVKSDFRFVSIKSVYRDLVDLMDTLSGGGRWVEKSPQNMFCIKHISRHIPDARFVHIVRDARDNIASILDAASKYKPFKKRFGGYDGIARATYYYNAFLRETVRCSGKSRHAVVRYEDIVADPLMALKPIEPVIDIEITTDMLHYDIGSIASDQEEWKINEKAIMPQKSKYFNVFSRSEREFIEENSLSADILVPRWIT